jgi:FkbM family methyltransferase
VVPCPSARIDEWARVAALVRRLRDCVQYLKPPLQGSAALQTRIFHKLRQELGVDVAGQVLAAGLRFLPDAQLLRLETVLKLAEASLPTSSLFDQFLESQRADVLLVSPLVHFGSAQADIVASARRLGVPVWMLLFSWDNLSTKGCMHVEPDLMFVWNERQRTEAEQLHGFTASRVVVVGAPRFDGFFALRPAMTREQFHEPLGLDPSKPTLLYVCSSRLIAPEELSFVRRWVTAVRASGSDILQDSNIVIRPHPDIALLPEEVPLVRHRWPAAPNLDAHVAELCADGPTVVLRTSYKDPQGLYESLVHSTAVVALNTTAELEAAIVGRPVLTMRPGEEDGGQQSTLHFHYLTRDQGGFVSVASGLEQHVAQLEQVLAEGTDPAPIRAFVESFLRPHGIDRAVSPMLADILAQRAGAASGVVPAPAQPSRTLVGPAGGEQDAAIARLGYKRARILVHVTPEAARHVVEGAIPVDRSTVDWLEQWVNVGDVVYDVNAGFGAYALIAAMQRGALVVAFEPGYKAYAALHENVVLNDCQASVIPVPLALADRDALADVKYERGRAGYGRYGVQCPPWRVRSPQAARPHVQSTCVTRLDTAVERYGLPPVNHLRLSPHAPVEVLEGSARTLASASLRTIWAHLAPHHEAAVTERLGTLGLGAVARRAGQRSVRIVFARGPGEPAAAGAHPVSSDMLP